MEETQHGIFTISIIFTLSSQLYILIQSQIAVAQADPKKYLLINIKIKKLIIKRL